MESPFIQAARKNWKNYEDSISNPHSCRVHSVHDCRPGVRPRISALGYDCAFDRCGESPLTTPLRPLREQLERRLRTGSCRSRDGSSQRIRTTPSTSANHLPLARFRLWYFFWRSLYPKKNISGTSSVCQWAKSHWTEQG